MLNTAMRGAGLALLATAGLLASAAASAAIIRIDFTVTNSGEIAPGVGLGTAGVTGSGYFVFDDAGMADGLRISPDNGIDGLLDLELNWNGASWTEADARIYGLDLQGGGIGFWGIGGLVNSCDGFPNATALMCVGPTASAPDFWLHSGGQPDDAAMRLAGGSDSYFGSVSWTMRTGSDGGVSVPEPATLSLLGLGLLGLGVSRRRRR